MRVRWNWIVGNALLALSAFLVLVEAQHHVRRAADAYDFAFFMDGARAIAAGAPLYPDGSGYLNGPSFAFVLRPLLWLDHRLAAQLWVALAMLLVPLIAVMGMRISRRTFTQRDLTIATLLLALTIPVRHTVTLGQVTLLATAVALGAWLAAGQDQVRLQALGGVLLWFAFELKPHYIWFVVLLFVWQQRWASLAATAASAALVNLVLWFAYPSAMWDSWLRLVFASRGSITSQPEQSTMGAAAVRFLGVAPGLSVAVTVAVAVAVWTITFRMVRQDANHLRAVVLVMAALPFVTPFSHPQDWVISVVALVVAIASAEDSRRSWLLPFALLLWALPDSQNLYVTPTVLSVLSIVAVGVSLAAWGRLSWGRAAWTGVLALLGLFAAELVPLRSHMQPIAALIGAMTWLALARDGHRNGAVLDAPSA